VAPETFELARLRLRRPKLSDADALFAIGSDSEVARYADWPLSTEMGPTLDRLRQRAELWDSGAEYYWVITLAHDDRAIGAVSTRVVQAAADVGYLLDRRHWGNGYATEAARAIVEWAFSTPSIHRVWATCDTENVASARVLEKAGLQREGTLRRAIVRPNLSNDPRDAFVYARVR
jgi:RimJ/RimL family protein N-acetyltransferase